MNKIISTIAILLLVIFASSCLDPTNNPNDSTKMLGIYLTDCPFEAEEVNVEIVNVIVEDKDGFKIELNTAIGVYNLLDFTDGVDTLIAEGNVEFEDIESIYLELGEQNTIIIEGEEFPLELKGDNLVKVNINLEQFDESTDFLVDFFACTSIIEKNGEYFLKPVIKFKGTKNNNQGGNSDFVEDYIEDIAGCYTLVYPYTLITKMNDEITVNNDEELTDALINNDIKSLAFPVTLQDVDGLNTTVDNNGHLKQLIKECEDENNNNGGYDENLEELDELLECYSLVYPIQVYSENDTIEITDASELANVIENEEFEAILLPFELVGDDGITFVVEENEELEELAEDCEEEEDDDDFEEFVEDIEECFEFVFPLDLLSEDNATFTANDQEELETLVEDEEINSFVYPIQLIDKDGQTIDAATKDELIELAEDCEEEEDFNEFIENLEDCYSLIYPVDLKAISNETFTANDQEEFDQLLDDEEIKSFVFPIQLLDEDNVIIDVNNQGELNQLENDCE